MPVTIIDYISWETPVKENLKVKDQAQIFQEKTGLSLRTFYSYRKLMETSS